MTRLVPEGLGAKLTLAECYESQGKLASAWTQYTVVESMAARTGQAIVRRPQAKRPQRSGPGSRCSPSRSRKK